MHFSCKFKSNFQSVFVTKSTVQRVRVRLVMTVVLKFLLQKKICRFFVVVLNFIAVEFYESTKNLLWIFGSAEHLYSCMLFLELWLQKKNLKIDCSEFGALDINKAVESTYSNYQSPPKRAIIIVYLIENFLAEFRVKQFYSKIFTLE